MNWSLPVEFDDGYRILRDVDVYEFVLAPRCPWATADTIPLAVTVIITSTSTVTGHGGGS